MILGAAAGVYVGFAVSDGRARELRVEAAVAVVFIIVASTGALMSPLLLAIGYVAHGVWDLLHHPKAVKTKVAAWWPPACLIYDWVISGFIVYRWAVAS